MKFERREFSALFAAAGAAPFLASQVLEALAIPSKDLTDEPVDQAAFDFWTTQVRQTSTLLTTRGGLLSSSLPSGARGSFLFYEDGIGFRLADSLDVEGLPEQGDIGVVARVDAFRPSSSDHLDVNRAKCCSLRVDFQQATPLQGLSEPLAWSTIASIFTADQLFTDYRDFGFDPQSTWGRLHTVPLPQGVGFWSWNLFMQKQEGIWGRIMKTLSVTRKAVGAFGIPGIAKTALDAVDGLVGFLQSREKNNWIVHTFDTPVFATKAARTKIPGRAMPLRSGQFVVTPEKQAEGLLQTKALEIKDGLIVPQGTKETELLAAAKDVLPGTSYITFSVLAERAG